MGNSFKFHEFKEVNVKEEIKKRIKKLIILKASYLSSHKVFKPLIDKKYYMSYFNKTHQVSYQSLEGKRKSVIKSSFITKGIKMAKNDFKAYQTVAFYNAFPQPKIS